LYRSGVDGFKFQCKMTVSQVEVNLCISVPKKKFLLQLVLYISWAFSM
jgi:hypothetical protein